jgi:hypothetical protein
MKAPTSSLRFGYLSTIIHKFKVVPRQGLNGLILLLDDRSWMAAVTSGCASSISASFMVINWLVYHSPHSPLIGSNLGRPDPFPILTRSEKDSISMLGLLLLPVATHQIRLLNFQCPDPVVPCAQSPATIPFSQRFLLINSPPCLFIKLLHISLYSLIFSCLKLIYGPQQHGLMFGSSYLNHLDMSC